MKTVWQIFWLVILVVLMLTVWFPIVLSPICDGIPPHWMEWVWDQADGR